MIRTVLYFGTLADGIGSPVGGTRKPQEAPRPPDSEIDDIRIKLKPCSESDAPLVHSFDPFKFGVVPVAVGCCLVMWVTHNRGGSRLAQWLVCGCPVRQIEQGSYPCFMVAELGYVK